jgi:uncharacterized protein (DUF58 family)
MFGEGWLVAIGLLLLASILVRDALLFLISLLLILATLIARWWYRHCLDRVEYRRSLSHRRAFFGEEVELTVEIVNRKLLPLAWLETEDEIPRELTPLHGTTMPSHKPARALLMNFLSLRWYERVRRHYRIVCAARGEHEFGPARMRSGDVFGFDAQEVELDKRDYLLVYPKVVPITRLGLPPRDPFGDRRTRDWLFEDPLNAVGVREYASGDSPRRIHWKATARTQQLQVKLYEPTTTYRLVVFLNLNTLGESWSLRYDPDLVELAIMAAASVASWAAEQGYQVGLSANGFMYRSGPGPARAAPSRDPEQLTNVLEVLARALPFASFPLEELLRRESRELPYGATLVVVTAVLNAPIAAELVALRRAGHRVTLLLVGDGQADVHLPGVPVYPIGGAGAWRELAELAVGG